MAILQRHPAGVAILAILVRARCKPLPDKRLRRQSRWPFQDGHGHLGHLAAGVDFQETPLVFNMASGHVGHLAHRGAFFSKFSSKSRRLSFPASRVLCSTGGWRF